MKPPIYTPISTFMLKTGVKIAVRPANPGAFIPIDPGARGMSGLRGTVGTKLAATGQKQKNRVAESVVDKLATRTIAHDRYSV
jgi:hypothetical protein